MGKSTTKHALVNIWRLEAYTVQASFHNTKKSVFSLWYVTVEFFYMLWRGTQQNTPRIRETTTTAAITTITVNTATFCAPSFPAPQVVCTGLAIVLLYSSPVSSAVSGVLPRLLLIPEDAIAVLKGCLIVLAKI
ncbi:hypothetical protein E2C01_009364 [Portunus trituberculatus]|uniref:Uncharacterized protein n=1 Tax=Portunus trituberculatus TaxID=210409 RepID=A0A5B7D5H8_PORTR|nr:hypothetical protein [Portunus trituberculatus]